MNGEENTTTQEKSQETQYHVSLRDYFATAALREIIASKEDFDPKPGQTYKQNIAELAYIYADAMLVEREKK
mgnify:CR=1 FL=1